MSDENKIPAAVDAQDTRTRKTVRLRSAAPATQDIPVNDPLASRDTDTGNLEILDDTQTRKTLKLKPMSPGSTPGPRLNLGGSEDTQTRKTVLLRPAASPMPGRTASPSTVRLDASEVAAALEENGADDQTRAVPRPAAAPGGIKLPGAAPQIATAPAGVQVESDDQTRAVPRPAAAPGGIKLPGAAPQIATAPAGVQVESDDQTRAVPRPAAAPGGIKLPGAAPQIATAPPAAKETLDDQTRAVPRPVAAPGGVKLPDEPEMVEDNVEDADDQTVKMKRPPRLGPPPAPVSLRPPVGGNARATVRLGGNAAKPAAPAPAAPAPAAPAAAPQVAAAAPAPQAAPVAPSAAAPAVPKPPTAVPKTPTAVPKPPTAVPTPPVAAATGAAPDAPPEAIYKPEAAETADVPVATIALAPKDDDKEIALADADEEKESANVRMEKSSVAGVAVDESNKPSVLYLCLAVATLLFVACAGVITSVHYLYFEQQMDYRTVIPALPNAE